MIQYLRAEKQLICYYFQVWMDNTKTDSGGKPDPFYVTEYTWALTIPNGQTEAEYLANIKNIITGLVNSQLQQMQIPQPTATPLTGF